MKPEEQWDHLGFDQHGLPVVMVIKEVEEPNAEAFVGVLDVRDILIVLNKDGTSTMTPVTDKGKEILPEAVKYEKGQTEFFVPPNWAHFEAKGLRVEVKDNR